MPASFDFFISYNRADRAWAEWIAWHLEDDGYTTVVQAWDFRPGGNFVQDMQNAAAGSERTLAVLSPDYLTSAFAAPEWAAAFARDPKGEKRLLLPVRVRECEPKGLLPQIVTIDLVGLNEAAARAALLAGVKRERAKPESAPDFPGAAPRPTAPKPRFPGALPSIWNVPYRRNPNFSGREALLAELRAALTSGQTAALTQALAGMGGVGKTQLAIEYLYRHRREYEIVWWIAAEQPVTLASDYAALAGPLGLAEKDAADQSLAVRAVRDELARRRDWLLVFDNVGAPEDVRDYLPQGGDGHTILTSRNPNWRRDARALSVRVWEREEALRFLLERTGQADAAAAGDLAEALGDLPLALEQAAAYVEQTETTLAEYLRLFRAHQLRVFGPDTRPASYEDTVATTWQLALERVGAVAALRRYSLVEATSETLSVHRLVQAVTRERLPDAEQKACAEAAARLVNDVFPVDSRDVRTWPDCARLLSHALAASDHAEALTVSPEATGRLLNQAGLYLNERAEFAEAKAAFERALKFGEAAYGPEHPHVAIRVNNLGSVLQASGDFAGAKAAYERALKIDEASYGPDHPSVAIDINNLGMVLQDSGDLAGARAAFERALRILQHFLGDDHPITKKAQANLNRVLT